MTLKQLEAFNAAASAGSFRLAAERLNLSQSSLSKRIAELEGQFGRPLFDRSGHRATLSEAGEVLLPLARRLLAEADQLRATMADRRELRGRCRFGVGEQTSLTWLPDLVALARRRHPELMLEPSVDIGSALEAQVASGALDFAVVADLPAREGVACEALAEVQFHWAGPSGDDGARLSPEMLRQTALITMPGGAGATRLVDHWLLANNLEPARRLSCNSMAAIAGLVMARVGVSCFPEQWLDHMAAQSAVTRLESDPPLPPLRYYLHWRRDDARPLIGRLRELVRETADFSKPNALWAAPLPAADRTA